MHTGLLRPDPFICDVLLFRCCSAAQGQVRSKLWHSSGVATRNAPDKDEMEGGKRGSHGHWAKLSTKQTLTIWMRHRRALSLSFPHCFLGMDKLHNYNYSLNSA